MALGFVVDFSALKWDPANDYRMKQIAMGSFHACAITDQGHVYCWGHNDSYQLGALEVEDRCTMGYQTIPCSHTPIPVPGLENIIDLALSDISSCALDDTGVVWCWGVSQTQLLNTSYSELCDLSWLNDPMMALYSCSPFPNPIDGINHAVSIGASGRMDETMESREHS